MAYQPGIPTGSVPLNQDYLSIQGNFSSLNTQFNEDHVDLTNTAPSPHNGYHKSVHLVPASTTTTNGPNNQPVVAPATTAGYGQVFDAEIDDKINVDTALYFLSSGGRLTQLTRNFQPLASSIGYTFLPGGLIMQWGLSTSGLTVTFNAQAKFTTVFAVNVTVKSLVLNGTNNINTPPQVVNLNNLTFSSGNKSGEAYTYFWTAIGI